MVGAVPPKGIVEKEGVEGGRDEGVFNHVDGASLSHVPVLLVMTLLFSVSVPKVVLCLAISLDRGHRWLADEGLRQAPEWCS